MTISINQINSGIGLKIDTDLFIVEEYHHVKPGKGSAFVRVKLRNLKTSNVIERTFRTADRLEDIALEENTLQFTYRSGNTLHFMDHTTYEEVTIAEEVLGDSTKFLLDHLEVTGILHDGKLLKITLPNFIIAQITQTEPGIKGDSSRSGNKPAKIQTGAVVPVPLFINEGDWIKIDTRSSQYVERVQK